jgi:hypothetical protein
MADFYRTTHVGLGPIGREIARLAAERRDAVPVAASELSPEMAGRDLYEVVGVEGPAPVRIDPDMASALATPSDIVLHATGSRLPEVMPQLVAAIRAGRNVISTCEELSYPWRRHPALAAELDREARRVGVTVLGTGINPGFVLDTLVLCLTAVCGRVRRIDATRVVDVSRRREQLQRKVGVGLVLDEFRARAAAGLLGHVGLSESAWLVAQGLGWELEDLRETIEPVPGEGGVALGARQVVTACVGGREALRLSVEMAAGAAHPRDEMVIEGDPPVHVLVEGGIPGDVATASVVVNCIPAVVTHEPGLVTMLDLPVPRSTGA